MNSIFAYDFPTFFTILSSRFQKLNIKNVFKSDIQYKLGERNTKMRESDRISFQNPYRVIRLFGELEIKKKRINSSNSHVRRREKIVASGPPDR